MDLRFLQMGRLSFVDALIKPASSLCDFNCSYCFYREEVKERLHPSTGLMSEAMVSLLIDQML